MKGGVPEFMERKAKRVRPGEGRDEGKTCRKHDRFAQETATYQCSRNTAFDYSVPGEEREAYSFT